MAGPDYRVIKGRLSWLVRKSDNLIDFYVMNVPLQASN